MKKSLILGLLGLAATVVPSFGQGVVFLSNYNTGGNYVTYGANVPANGVSGANGSGGVTSSWTEGIYYVVGTPVVPSDPNALNIGDPSVFGGMTLATGANSTAPFQSSAFGTAGAAQAGGVFVVPGTSAGGGTTITVMTVGYSGSDYASSLFRGHSTPYTLAVSANNSPSPIQTGTGMTAFSVNPVPEPSIFALSGLGAAALMLIRRKKLA